VPAPDFSPGELLRQQHLLSEEMTEGHHRSGLAGLSCALSLEGAGVK
jgi:hypothetical protein